MSLRNIAHQEPDRRQGGTDQLADAIRATSITCPDERFSFHHAAEYLERGWSVLPLNGKRPAIPSWAQYQTCRPTHDEIRSWFSASSGSTPHNIGIVTGSISGLVVVDCDTADAVAWCKEHFTATPLASTTGRGGAHFYYRLDGNATVRNRVGIRDNIDLRGEGGYVVAPPSHHPETGTLYKWLPWDHYSLGEIPVFDPNWVAQASAGRQRSATRSVIHDGPAYILSIKAVSGEGGHNATFRAACRLRDAGMTPEQALAALIEWNELNAFPKWSVNELLHKVQDAFKK